MDVETAKKLEGRVVMFETIDGVKGPFTVHDVVKPWRILRVYAYGGLAEIELSDIKAYIQYEPTERIECK